jgi:hypothetical protein
MIRESVRPRFLGGTVVLTRRWGPVDLAKSLMALDERKDLLAGWQEPGSALEIIFLYALRSFPCPIGDY